MRSSVKAIVTVAIIFSFVPSVLFIYLLFCFLLFFVSFFFFFFFFSLSLSLSLSEVSFSDVLSFNPCLAPDMG